MTSGCTWATSCFSEGSWFSSTSSGGSCFAGLLRQRGIQPILAKRNTEHGSGLRVFRWVVERTNSRLHQFRRLRVRFERRADIHRAFLTLGCTVICSRYLLNPFC
jgi:transposase